MLTSKFTDPIDVQDLGSGRWELQSSLAYLDSRYGDTITVPIGFTTDFASVPRALWSILPPAGNYAAAAVLHDYLYSTGGLQGKYDRAQCDLLFRDGMQVLGISWATRMSMYAGVRIGGGKFFKGAA